MSGTVKSVINTIQFGDLSNEELNQVAQAVAFRRSQLAQSIKRSLSVGSSVKFFSTRFNKFLQGKVEKVAIKYITVTTPVGRWRVPANMLEVV